SGTRPVEALPPPRLAQVVHEGLRVRHVGEDGARGHRLLRRVDRILLTRRLGTSRRLNVLRLHYVTVRFGRASRRFAGHPRRRSADGTTVAVPSTLAPAATRRAP